MKYASEPSLKGLVDRARREGIEKLSEAELLILIESKHDASATAADDLARALCKVRAVFENAQRRGELVRGDYASSAAGTAQDRASELIQRTDAPISAYFSAKAKAGRAPAGIASKEAKRGFVMKYATWIDERAKSGEIVNEKSRPGGNQITWAAAKEFASEAGCTYEASTIRKFLSGSTRRLLRKAKAALSKTQPRATTHRIE